MKRTFIFLLALTGLAQTIPAALLYSEGFNYAPGALSGNDSWLGGSGGLTVGNGNNLTYPGLDDLGGNALLNSQGTAGSMTVNFSANPITSGSVYYSFLAAATTLPTANNYLTDLLVNGATPNGSGDPLAVYVGQQVAGSQFKIGVRHQGIGTGATYTSGTSMTLNTVNLFVVKYTFGSGGTVSLFVNPTPGGAEPGADVTVTGAGTDAANLQTLGFKVNGNTTSGNWVLDTLRVGTSWTDVTPSGVPEPSSLALLVLGGIALGCRRKSR